ncbi:hypothetical protein A4U49_12945 [Acidithiobacillus ferrivorans]|nr:hypothetical protein A4U49_12945 [Acidithiobacillus ferrivorans]
MKCYQCDRPAMYQIGEQNIPLCLDCYFKFSQIQQQQLESSERMMNYLSDEMAASVGLPPMGPRFPPRPQPVVVAGAKLHNIHVNNSVVGTINTGSIGLALWYRVASPSLPRLLKPFRKPYCKAVTSHKTKRTNSLKA